jgi:hypothetical protein
VLSLLIEIEDAGLRDEWLGLAQAAQFEHTSELAEPLDQNPVDDEALRALENCIGAERVIPKIRSCFLYFYPPLRKLCCRIRTDKRDNRSNQLLAGVELPRV